MLKFEENRIYEIGIVDKRFDKQIPIIAVDPKIITNESVVFIYSGGVGNTNSICKYMNNLAFDENYFISYEKAGHGNNTNKTSQYRKKSIKELDAVVDWVKQTYPNRKIYLLGESWGTSIIFLYYVKNKNKVSGALGWNAPLGIVNPEKQSGKTLFKITMLEIISLLTNAELNLPPVQQSQELFSRDPLFARLSKMIPPSKTNTRITLSVWRYMSTIKKILRKYGKNSQYNFFYIQSEEDILAHKKALKKVERYMDNEHYYKMPTGYHVLSMEPNESIELNKRILMFIKH